MALTWTAPNSDGGSAITGYRITPYVNGSARTAVTATGTSTGYKVTGLTDGTTYTFAVAAINGAGTGANSAQTTGLTPVARRTVVSLEFDDDIATQYQVGALLKAHNMHATFYANSGLTGDSPGAWRFVVRGGRVLAITPLDATARALRRVA